MLSGRRGGSDGRSGEGAGTAPWRPGATQIAPGPAESRGEEPAHPGPDEDRAPCPPPAAQSNRWVGRRGGYAVVDLETSGPSPHRHRIIEVAVVRLDRDLRPEGEFTTLIDPQGPVGPTHIHGIVDRDVGGAPRFGEVAGHLLGLLSGRVLVAHHVNCDRAFLASEYQRLDIGFPPVPTLCTMLLADEYLPAAAGRSLRACCAAAHLSDYAAHTALGDARAAAGLLRYYRGLRAAVPVPWREALSASLRLKWPSIALTSTLPGLRRRALPAAGPAISARRMVPNVCNGGA